MPWVGVAEDAEGGKARELLERMGLSVRREAGLIELKTTRGWIKFRLYEVEGDVKGAADGLAKILEVPAFESGPHITLGEVSARLWDEGAKVVFPDGYSEVVALFTYDGFLDVRMPSANVRGLKATIVIGGKTYELPLKLSELMEIYSMGPKAVEKLEKAVSVYGLEKVISKEALEKLKQRKMEVKIEIDYSSGFVLIKEGARVRIVALKDYFIELLYRGDYERAKSVLEGAPANIRGELIEAIRGEYRLAKEYGEEERAKLLLEAAEKLGLQL